MVAFVQWLQSTSMSLGVRRLGWLVPLMQTLHILANGLILSAVIMIELRVWGRASFEPLRARMRRFLPWLWAAMGALTATGLVLVIAAPRRTLLDATFQAKMLLLTVAIAATLIWSTMLRRVAPDCLSASRAARIMAGVTLLLWLGVTVAGRGRWIASLLG